MGSARLGMERIRVGIAIPDGGAKLNAWSTARELASNPSWPTVLQLDAFCSALEDAIGVDVVPHGLADYRTLLDAMVDGEVDLAWLPPVVALRATASGRTIPIALPVRNGTAYYSTALFTRGDSPIVGARDLRAVRAAWVDRQSAAGYLVIRASLRMRGVDLGEAFASDVFLGSHDLVTRAVLEGTADVGATYVLLDPRRSAPVRAGWGSAPVRMLATAGPIPADVIAATVRMPVPAIRALQSALVKPTEAVRRAAVALFTAEGFVEADSEHLAPLSEVLSHIDERPEKSAVFSKRARRTA